MHSKSIEKARPVRCEIKEFKSNKETSSQSRVRQGRKRTRGAEYGRETILREGWREEKGWTSSPQDWKAETERRGEDKEDGKW
eukprot:jgi/Antlo1/688/1526